MAFAHMDRAEVCSFVSPCCIVASGGVKRAAVDRDSKQVSKAEDFNSNPLDSLGRW